MSTSEFADHHGSHRNLLWTPDDGGHPHGLMDAVIVPTARRVAYLKEAARLATQLGCPLVTLHSGKWTNATAAAQRLSVEPSVAGLDLIAIDVPAAGRLRLPRLETSRLLAGPPFARQTDVSHKRNIALVLSHLLGWSRIFFVDDDITGLNPADLQRAAGLLGTHNAVGLFVDGYPDHSVVCHAFRLSGGQQQSFIGGGALAVEVQRSRSFFPDIYNDDWFFMLDAKKGLQPVAGTGRVIQRPYDPFRSPERARGEELGDVLAEGIYWLLDQGRSVADADLDHWSRFLARRHSFIKRVQRMVEEADVPGGEPERARMISALKGSLGRLALITPELCQHYLHAWVRDRERWERHLRRLPACATREAAVAALARPGEPPPKWHSLPAPGRQGRSARVPVRAGG
jgi:hypothetical protein